MTWCNYSYGSGSKHSIWKTSTFVQKIWDWNSAACFETTGNVFFEWQGRIWEKLAYDVTERNNFPHRFNREQGITTDKWFYRFLSCHLELSLRSPQATSMATASVFNTVLVSNFFTPLRKAVDDYHFDAMSIFNMDDTSLSTVHKPWKELGNKGKH